MISWYSARLSGLSAKDDSGLAQKGNCAFQRPPGRAVHPRVVGLWERGFRPLQAEKAKGGPERQSRPLPSPFILTSSSASPDGRSGWSGVFSHLNYEVFTPAVSRILPIFHQP